MSLAKPAGNWILQPYKSFPESRARQFSYVSALPVFNIWIPNLYIIHRWIRFLYAKWVRIVCQVEWKNQWKPEKYWRPAYFLNPGVNTVWMKFFEYFKMSRMYGIIGLWYVVNAFINHKKSSTQSSSSEIQHKSGKMVKCYL